MRVLVNYVKVPSAIQVRNLALNSARELHRALIKATDGKTIRSDELSEFAVTGFYDTTVWIRQGSISTGSFSDPHYGADGARCVLSTRVRNALSVAV